MYCVIDVETTGFHAGGNDRIVEIAAVRLDREAAPRDEWTTLVNPDRDIGPTRVHGIRAGDVTDAPRFRDLAGAVAERLAGSVVVAHNFRFDWSFVKSEFRRIGVELPEVKGVCTLQWSARLGLEGPRTLAGCCARLGVPHKNAHEALADARAAAGLLRAELALARERDVPLDPPVPVPSEVFPPLPRSGVVRPRGRHSPADRDSPLARFVARLSTTPAAGDAPPEAARGYAEILDRALEDRRLSEEEVLALAGVARDWDLAQDSVWDCHRSYLTSLIAAAMADGHLSSAEEDDIRLVGRLLALAPEVDDLLRSAKRPETRIGVSAVAPEKLAGRSVCFTGESVCSVRGCQLDRATQELLAANAGLVVAPRVTKRLDILVLADPDSMSGKARLAANYGIRRIAEREFWRLVGVNVD